MQQQGVRLGAGWGGVRLGGECNKRAGLLTTLVDMEPACHVMSCHVMSCHVMSCHVMSCHVMSCHVMSCHVMSCHVMSCHVMSCHVMSQAVTSESHNMYTNTSPGRRQFETAQPAWLQVLEHQYKQHRKHQQQAMFFAQHDKTRGEGGRGGGGVWGTKRRGEGGGGGGGVGAGFCHRHTGPDVKLHCGASPPAPSRRVSAKPCSTNTTACTV